MHLLENGWCRSLLKSEICLWHQEITIFRAASKSEGLRYAAWFENALNPVEFVGLIATFLKNLSILHGALYSALDLALAINSETILAPNWIWVVSNSVDFVLVPSKLRVNCPDSINDLIVQTDSPSVVSI